jgi:hypothetical protein
MSSEVNVLFIALPSLFDRTQGPVYGGKVGKVAWNLNTRSSGLGAPNEVNRFWNCAHCNRGLNTMSGEVNVLFIALPSLFDRTQGPVSGRKDGKVAWNLIVRSSGLGTPK